MGPTSTGEGTLAVTNTASTTFSNAVGAINSLESLVLSGGDTTFQSTVASGTIMSGSAAVSFADNCGTGNELRRQCGG